MNYVDIIILICVVAFISVVLYFNIRNLKNNKGGCTNCPYSKDCNKQTAKNNKEPLKCKKCTENKQESDKKSK